MPQVKNRVSTVPPATVALAEPQLWLESVAKPKVVCKYNDDVPSWIASMVADGTEPRQSAADDFLAASTAQPRWSFKLLRLRTLNLSFFGGATAGPGGGNPNDRLSAISMCTVHRLPNGGVQRFPMLQAILTCGNTAVHTDMKNAVVPEDDTLTWKYVDTITLANVQLASGQYKVTHNGADGIARLQVDVEGAEAVEIYPACVDVLEGTIDDDPAVVCEGLACAVRALSV